MSVSQINVFEGDSSGRLAAARSSQSLGESERFALVHVFLLREGGKVRQIRIEEL
jgi:hypothetical protein